MKEVLSQERLALFLPEGILDYFIIVSYETSFCGKQICEKQLDLSLDEKDIIPAEYKNNPYKASGFMEARIIDDYPIRNMLVKL